MGTTVVSRSWIHCRSYYIRRQYCGNFSHLNKRTSNTRKSKYIEYKAWWLHKLYISNGDIDLTWLPTEKMLADTFTKLLDNKRNLIQKSKVISGRAGTKISHKDDYILFQDDQQPKGQEKDTDDEDT